MTAAELDRLLREITPREQFYIDNPGAPSPRYRNMERRNIHGREVLCFQLSELAMDEIHIRKDSRFTDVPYYMHSNININYIYSGHCDYVIDGTPITLRRGDVCIFDLDVVRRKLYLGPDDIVINLNMTNEFFSNSFFRKAGEQSVFSDFALRVLSAGSSVHDHYLIFRTGDNSSVNALFQELLIEYFSEAPFRKQMMQGYFQLIFLHLLRLHQQDAENNLVQIASVHSKNVLDILYYIELHHTDCTLAGLAEEFGYHPKYITSLLKKITGSSFKELQTRERMKAAARQLLQTSDSIQEIAHKVGMTNMTAFYRAFQKHFGVLPNQYRHTSDP